MQPTPPGGDEVATQPDTEIPFEWPDLREFLGEGALLKVLQAARKRSARAARVAVRRWVDRHNIPTLRVGQTRFYPRCIVWRAFARDNGVPLHRLLASLRE